jgi:hypothetical protein
MIVFVKTREAARVISDLVAKEFSNDGLQTGFIVGHGNGTDGKGMDHKQQEEVARKFRDGEINVLVGTTVVEEGLDVQSCNTVVRYNDASTVNSFIQSRGRARARGSDFVVFYDADNEEQGFDKIEEMQRKEGDMLRAVHMAMKGDLQLRSLLDMLKDSGARKFLEEDAMGILEQYCIAKAGRGPTFEVSKARSIGHDSKYVATVVIPPGSGFRLEHTGDDCYTPYAARKSAAYDVCVELHNHGLLEGFVGQRYVMVQHQSDSGGLRSVTNVERPACAEALESGGKEGNPTSDYYYCGLCQLNCGSRNLLEMHKTSKQHEKRVQEDHQFAASGTDADADDWVKIQGKGIDEDEEGPVSSTSSESAIVSETGLSGSPGSTSSGSEISSNPVGALNELQQQGRITHRVECMAAGAGFLAIMQIKITGNVDSEQEFTAEGRNKKDAKQAASQLAHAYVLSSGTIHQPPAAPPVTTTPTVATTSPTPITVPAPQHANPIGALKELKDQGKLDVLADESSKGIVHAFSVTVRVRIAGGDAEEQTFTAERKKKKDAKKAASQLALNYVYAKLHLA